MTQIATSVVERSASFQETSKNLENISRIAKKTQAATENLKTIFDVLKSLSYQLKTMLDEFRV